MRILCDVVTVSKAARNDGHKDLELEVEDDVLVGLLNDCTLSEILVILLKEYDVAFILSKLDQADVEEYAKQKLGMLK